MKGIVFTIIKTINMKTIKFLILFVITGLLITSCEEEDNGTPQQVTKTYTYSENIRGSVGVMGTLELPELNLSDVIGTEAANNFKNAEMQLADSYLEISGLNQLEASDTIVVVLEDFTIKVGSRQGVNLGNFSTDPQEVNEYPSDEELSTNTIVNLIQNIFTDVTTGNKNAKITVSFTPNVDITSSNNVQLKITFGGKYNYLVFQ